MTKKDFVATAQALKDARDALGTNTQERQNEVNRVFDSLSRSLADCFMKLNPRFNRARFLTACGVQTR